MEVIDEDARGCLRVFRAFRSSLPAGIRILSTVCLPLVVAVLLVAVGYAQSKTLTYASGSDGMTYVRAANEVLDGTWPGASGFPFAPGFPYILAASIWVGGPFSPYWVNCLFLGASVLIVLRTSVYVTSDRGLAALLALLSLAGLAGLFPNSLPFLMLPFREMSALFFIALGHLLLLVAAGSRPKNAVMALAGLSALLASGIREPSALAFVGPVIYFMTRTSAPLKERLVQLCWFLAPFILISVLMVFTATGKALLFNQQGQGWMRFFSLYGLDALTSRWNLHGIRSSLMLVGMVSVPGLTAFLAGLVYAFIRYRALFFLHGITAILFFAFYSIMEAHHRYLVTVEWFMLPVMALGLFWALRFVEEQITRRWVRPGWAIPLVSILAVVWLFQAIGRIQPMGSKTTASQITGFTTMLKALPREVDTAVTTPASRYASDALQSFTDLKIDDASQLRPEQMKTRTYAVVDPINPAATFRGGYYPYYGMSARRILHHYADILDFSGTEGYEEVVLGEGTYSLSVSRPWSSYRVQQPIDRRHVVADLLWLDFRSSDPTAARTVTWKGADGTQLGTWDIPEGNGLVPIYLGPNASISVGSFLLVESSALLPASLTCVPRPFADCGCFYLDMRRSLSAMKWIAEPASLSNETSKWGSSYSERTAYRLPLPVGVSNESLWISVVSETQRLVDEDVVFEYRVSDERVATYTNNLTHAGMYHRFLVKGPFTDRYIDVETRADPVISETQYRVVFLGMGVVGEEGDL